MKQKKQKEPQTFPNVAVLSSGLYGYIFNKQAIFRHDDLAVINTFAKWANNQSDAKVILAKAIEMQQQNN